MTRILHIDTCTKCYHLHHSPRETFCNLTGIDVGCDANPEEVGCPLPKKEEKESYDAEWEEINEYMY